MSSQSFDKPVRIGVSSCLAGNPVRYDGFDARDEFVVETLASWFDLVPVCPEVEMGMNTPRPTIRLVDEGEGLRLISPSTDKDFTDSMHSFSARKIKELKKFDLDGYIFKKSSPSCGVKGIKVYRRGEVFRDDGVGFFAQCLMDAWPNLPIEDEGGLADLSVRENFINRVFNRGRWRKLTEKGLSRGTLVDFHTAHKLLLLSHHEIGYRKLGYIVGSFGEISDQEIFKQYEQGFASCLSVRPTIKTHVNVLQHALGHLKNRVTAEEKFEILNSIEDFRHGKVLRLVPLNLLTRSMNLYDSAYLLGQVYFNPYPKELMSHT